MCGIAGFVNLGMNREECRNLASNFLLALEYRGKDATGIYTAGNITKVPISASEFVKKGFVPYGRWGDITLLHTRAATKGSPAQNDNNHPLRGNRWVLIHNGVLSMSRIATYPYKGEVDSEILLSYIEEYGVLRALKEVEGSAVTAFCQYTRRDTFNKLYLWTNAGQLYIAALFNGIKAKAILFASTEKAITTAIKYYERHFGLFLPVSIAEAKNEMLYTIEVSKKKRVTIQQEEAKCKSKGFTKFGYYYPSYARGYTHKYRKKDDEKDDRIPTFNYDNEKYDMYRCW